MGEVRSEVEAEEDFRVLQKHELEALRKREKKEGKKGSAESGDGCCEPLCSPITCGP